MPTEVHIKGIDGPVFFPDNMSHSEIEAAIKNEIIPAHAPSYWDTFKNAVPKGAAGIVDSVLNVGPNTWNLGKMAIGSTMNAMGRPDLAPDVTPPQQLANEAGRGLGLIKDSAEPVDLPGRFVDMAGQVLGGGGINPGAIARSAARGAIKPIVRDVAAAGASSVGAATGQELARNADFGGDGANALAQAVLTFGGGAAAGGAAASRGTAGDRAAAAIKGVTPEQIAAARATMDKATAAGSPITPYEAIQSVTGMNPKMQTQQRVAEQSDAAAHSLTPMMQARPANNTALFNKTADSIAPANPLPDTLAGRLQGAAQGAIDAARNNGNAKAAPYYAKSSNDPTATIPPHDWNTVASDPAIAWALDQVKRNPLGGMQNAKEGSIQWLDAAKKFLDSKGIALGQAGERYFAGQAKTGARQITDAIDPVNPAYAKARAVVADNMQNVVTPMEASQVGKLSRSDDFGQQTAALLPEKPLDVTPQVIDRTASTIGAQDPTILRDVLAQHLRGQFNEANQSNIAGPNVFGGSKFAAKIGGNPGQADNLNAAVTASGGDAKALADALDVFKAQGMKPAVNSATASNLNEASLLGGQKLTDVVMRPWRAIPGAVDNWRNGWSTKALAEALASPTGLETIQELARMNGAYSPSKQQVLANILRATPESSATQ